MIFVHISLAPFISDVCSDAVTTGIGNTLGNKGGVAIRLKIGDVALMFINCHLAAHQNAVEERNNNVKRIESELFSKSEANVFNRVSTSSLDVPDEGDPKRNRLLGLGDVVVFMGDMNYRIRGNR